MVVLASLITESVLARLGPLIAISNSSLTDSSFNDPHTCLQTNDSTMLAQLIFTAILFPPMVNGGLDWQWEATITTLMATTFPVKQYI